MKYFIGIFFFCFAFLFAEAQHPYAIHIDKSNGLPSNAVYCVFQDSKGFVWFATNSGLSRYDGFEFKTYTSNFQTSAAGSSIIEDVEGRIWYENFDGYLYYVENDSLKAFAQNKPITYIPIAITSNYLFTFQINGVDVYDIKTLAYIKTIETSMSTLQTCTVVKNNIYFIAAEKLCKIDENLVLTACIPFNENISATKQLYSVGELVCVINKLNEKKQAFLFNDKLNLASIKSINNPEFIQGLNYVDSILWVHSPNGTFAYSSESNDAKPLFSYFNDKGISCVMKDRQSNYWFSTTNDGVYLVPDLTKRVFVLGKYMPNKIVETPKGFIVATKRGELIDCDKSFETIRLIEKKVEDPEIYYLHYDSVKNDLFYSSAGFKYIPNLNYNRLEFYNTAIKEIVKLDDTYYAYTSSGNCGLAKFSNSNNLKSIWDKVFEDTKNPLMSTTSRIIDAIRGKSLAYNIEKEEIYFATNLGLFKCTPSSTTEIKYNNESFYASKVISFKDVLYVLSTKGNLYRLSNQSNFVLLNEKLGINSGEIKAVKQFANSLVIICNQSVYLFDMQSEQVSEVDINISAFEINDVLLSKGDFYLITNAGIIKTGSAPSIRKGAILEIVEFKADGKKMNFTSETILNYNQNDVSIRLSVLDFGRINANKVSYRINNEEWKLIPSETRSIEFASLSPGNYLIEFKLNDEITKNKVQFVITSPFWKKTWFYILCFGLTMFTGFLYYKWQLRKLNAKNKLLEDKNTLLLEKMELESSLNKSVLTSIKSQMNPHFFYNALNTIQAYIFTNDKKNASSYLAKFSKLTRMILEMSEKEQVHLQEELSAIKLYLELEKMRFEDDFEYSIVLDESIDVEMIKIPPMILQPYIENAIKHGLLHKTSEKKLQIEFSREENYLKVVIDDNGIGRLKAGELGKIKLEKHQSFSSEANEKRLAILNRNNKRKVTVNIIDKRSDTGNPLGTTVELFIPINNF